MKRWFKLAVIFTALVLSILSALDILPLVVVTSAAAPLPTDAPRQGLIHPLATLDWHQPGTEVYVLVSRSDLNALPVEIPHTRCLMTSDSAVVGALVRSFAFHATGGDVATAESRLLVKQAGRIVFSTGIVLEKSQVGLQDSGFGWAPSPDGGQALRRVFARFHAASPLLVVI